MGRLLVLAIVGVCFCGSIHASETVKSLVSKLEHHLQNGEVSIAISSLDDVDVAALAKFEAKQGSPKFLAISSFNLEIPGVPQREQFRLQESGGYITVPGVGKEYPYAGSDWEKAIFSFAFRLNLHLRYRTSALDVERSQYPLENCRELLQIDQHLWKTLSLESRLRIQILVENYAEAEAKLSGKGGRSNGTGVNGTVESQVMY